MLVTVIWQDHGNTEPNDFNIEEISIDIHKVPPTKTMVAMAMAEKGYDTVKVRETLKNGYALVGIVDGRVRWLE